MDMNKNAETINTFIYVGLGLILLAGIIQEIITRVAEKILNDFVYFILRLIPLVLIYIVGVMWVYCAYITEDTMILNGMVSSKLMLNVFGIFLIVLGFIMGVRRLFAYKKDVKETKLMNNQYELENSQNGFPNVYPRYDVNSRKRIRSKFKSRYRR